MACQEFTVLYTHQKTKKSKVWQDGILKATFGGNKATLYDDKGQLLDSVFIKCQIKPGDDFESERYLITVENENVYEIGCKDHLKNKERSALTRNSSKPHAASSVCRLKRKYSDFQVPRQLEKKKIVEEPSAALPSISEGPQSFFPHRFYVSSPLFSVPCKKKEDTILLPNFSGDASTKNTKTIEPMSLLSSNLFDDEHEVVQNKKHSTDSVADEYLKSEFQLENGVYTSNYPANKGEAVSQNIRSKAQIVALLNNSVKESKIPDNECTTLMKNQKFTVVKSESNPEVLPLFESISIDPLLKNRVVPLSGFTNNASRETIKHIYAQHTEKTEQAKSRWDIYMPSYLPDKHNAEHHEESTHSLQQIQKGLKESVNRRQINKDQRGISQMLSSWKTEISSVRKSSVKSQPCDFLSAESIMSESKSGELNLFDNTNLNCIHSLKTFEDRFSDSDRMIESLEGICPSSADLGSSEKQVTEVNFNLLETMDFSDTEDNELNADSMILQGSVSLKEEIQPQPEGSAQKNCDVKLFSIGRKYNIQSAFLQDDLNSISDSQPLQFRDEFSPKPIKNMESLGKWQNSKISVINEKVDTNAIHDQNLDIHEQLLCTDRSFLMENNIDYELHDIKQNFTEVSCPEDAQKLFLHSESQKLPLSSRNLIEDDLSDSATKTFNKDFNFFEEKVNNKFLTKSVPFKPPNQIVTNSSSNLDLDFTNCASLNFSKLLSEQCVPSQTTGCHFPSTPSSKESMHEQEFLMPQIVADSCMDNKKSFIRMGESRCQKNDMSILLPALRTQASVVSGFVDNQPSDSQVYFSAKICKQIHQPFGFSVVNTYGRSKMLGPEDRMCEKFVSKKYIEERKGMATQNAFPKESEQRKQSKWQKYHNTTDCDLRSQNSNEVAMAKVIHAESFLGMSLEYTGENQNNAISKSPLDSLHLETIKRMLCKQQRNFSSQDSVSERRKLSLNLNQHFSTEEALAELGHLNCPRVTRQSKDTSELYFPRADVVKSANIPKRQTYIPVEFQSPAHYRKVFTTALTEHLNILLFELSQNLHKALGKVDISFYTSAKGGQPENSAPLCSHKIATKLVMVRKEGRNKGRLFYVCDAPKSDRCDYFKWLEDVKPKQIENKPYVKLHDMKSIGTYLRCQRISIYEECQLLIRRTFDIQRKQFGKLKKYNITKASFDCDSKSKLFLKLNRKEHSSAYSKDDIWVISKTLSFESVDTFIACSVFFGPSSNNEVELEPLNGYSPSNWCSNMIVHALLVCNASTELANLRNIEENVSSITLPIMQHLLTKTFKESSPRSKFKKQKFKPPSLNSNAIKSETFSPEMIINIAGKMIQTFQLNKDQATAVMQIGAMVTMQEINTETGKHQAFPITIIHGVFGSGKSYLLAIIILFLIQIFEISEAADGKRSVPWKVLISSSTNVAVDRILLSLLDIGFKDFIRVGSIKKIAKPILPYSLHAGSGPENEQLKELLSLMKEDLSPVEKIYVKKTIEHHKLGINKASLQKVRVVGSTCAACPFPCIKNLKFPVVILDECSQMTEPSSLLPIARFECEKLILVGDPKQLPPTIQGSESAHGSGLEQTLFDRLCLMGHEPILLRTQYRCHPVIAAITNKLFYEGIILNGVSETNRSPLLEWLPTLCFYNVNGSEQMERDNSFHNMAESFFIVKLIQSLISSGIDGSVIGVITLYKSQMSKIRNLLGAVHLDASQIKAVQVSTVDAFQGAEKEIIVLSCVRTRKVGFIDSEKRVNVALSRGKRHLLIIGNLNCLRRNKLWGSIIQHCAGRKNGLQHVSQCEQQLNDIIKSFTRNAKEEINMKKMKI